MSIAVALTNYDTTQNEIVVDGTLTLTGNYGGGSTHGDTLNLSGLDIKSGSVPTRVAIWEAPAAGTSATGYSYNFSPGTTQANGVMQVFGTGASSGAAGTEYTQGSAYSAPLLAAVVKFKAWFASL